MIILVLGSNGSGKSAYAEGLAAQLSSSALYYIATMPRDWAGAEARIARHREGRKGHGFTTIEQTRDIGSVSIPAGGAALLECLGNLVANEMFGPGGAGAGTFETVSQGLENLARQAGRLVVVSNDVFGEGMGHVPETAEYCRVLASLNQLLARKCAVVAEVVCGIPLWLKGNGEGDA